jgi:CheY-like chemotaxis protein/anti-sigma regulatory factor (Ser/Thr protein kinase)
VIERQVGHVVGLVDDLLDVSRIARGKIELRPTPVELGEIVSSALEATAPLLEEQRHVVEVDVPDSGLLVPGDVIRLTQVVMNILTNAAKYTPPQGHIRVTAAREDAAVVLRVRDTGIGISAELLPCVFDMFTQGRQDLDRSEGGLGLGLTIVKSLVALHGGEVEARSEGPGTGTEFVVRLPALAAEAAARALAADVPGIASDVPFQGRRVLIVDDNEDAAHLMAEALGALGHDVRVALDGPAALEAAAAFDPEVAVLDLGLPLMDGFELARQLCAWPDRRPIRLVAVTGYGQLSDQQRTEAAGFHAHLVKPVDLDTLAQVLDRLLVTE